MARLRSSRIILHNPHPSGVDAQASGVVCFDAIGVETASQSDAIWWLIQAEFFHNVARKLDKKMELKGVYLGPTWTLLAWDKDSWIETSNSYLSEEDALDALRSAESRAEQDDDAPFHRFAIMRDDADTFPPAPAS